MTQEQVIEQRLVKCGLKAGGISVKYEEDLQSIEVIIGPAARANQGHFECIKDAAAHEIVTFEDGAMYKAYNDYTSEAARPQMLESLTATLRERKLLQGFPERGSFQSLGEFARALEKHAGTKPGAALRVDGDGIVFDPPHEANLPADFAAKYSDLLSVVMFASVRDHISFGFIGNEAVSPDR
ncbi:hypothetical protein FA702_18255 (plasmid) [Novosphingobium sp. EMRT-2]|nr:hypothetical protein FA702_17830 [Novosphingobium sp. EMRT-2]QCI95629.1 hypothetical protein FA702_18255 [Novosphingobium sp. EMRT-2]